LLNSLVYFFADGETRTVAAGPYTRNHVTVMIPRKMPMRRTSCVEMGLAGSSCKPADAGCRRNHSKFPVTPPTPKLQKLNSIPSNSLNRFANAPHGLLQKRPFVSASKLNSSHLADRNLASAGTPAVGKNRVGLQKNIT
jgi:hypothetical protein